MPQKSIYDERSEDYKKQAEVLRNIAQHSFNNTREPRFMKVGDRTFRRIMFRSSPLGRIFSQIKNMIWKQ